MLTNIAIFAQIIRPNIWQKPNVHSAEPSVLFGFGRPLPETVFFFFEKKAYPLGDRILLGLGSPSKPGGGGKESPPSLRMISSL